MTSKRAVLQVKHKNGTEYMLMPMNKSCWLEGGGIAIQDNTNKKLFFNVPLTHLEGPFEIATSIVDMDNYF